MTNDLATEIRRIIDVVEPVSPSEAVALAAVMGRTGKSMARGRDVGVRGSWHRPRVFGLVTAALAAVAMIPIVFTVLSPTTSSAVSFLNHAIEVTNSQPPIPSLGAGQYYYESVHESGISGCRVVTQPDGSMGLLAGVTSGQPFLVYLMSWDQERWATANGSGGGRNMNQTGHFVNAAQQAEWAADGSPSLENCAGPLTTSKISPTTTGPGTESGLLALPTSPDALGSLIAEGRVNPYGVVSPKNVMCPANAGGGAPTPEPNGDCSPAEQFDVASALLQQPEGPQLVGPALFQILARLSGVTDIGSVTDANGRVGIGIEYTESDHSTVFVIDPANGQLLEEQTLASNSMPASWGISAGAASSTTTFGTLSVVNGLGDTPNS